MQEIKCATWEQSGISEDVKERMRTDRERAEKRSRIEKNASLFFNYLKSVDEVERIEAIENLLIKMNFGGVDFNQLICTINEKTTALIEGGEF